MKLTVLHFLSLPLALSCLSCSKPEQKDDPKDDPRESVCLIHDASELCDFLSGSSSAGEGAAGELACDIDLSGVTLPQVGLFEGVLDGKGHSLMKWSATGPLFTKLSGVVKNLVIAGDCTLTVKGSGNSAFIAGENAGHVKGCTNNGTVELKLSGAASGTCNIAALAACSVAGGSSATLVSDCVNNGRVGGSMTGNNKDVNIGGICGLVEGAKGGKTVVSCTNTAPVSISLSASANPVRCGGVCGCAEDAALSDCLNSGRVKTSVSVGAGASVFYTGGIAGSISGSLGNSRNTADLTMEGAPDGSAAGGLCGLCGADIVSCGSECTLTVTGSAENLAGCVAGKMNATNTISGTDVKCTLTCPKQSKAGYVLGGVSSSDVVVTLGTQDKPVSISTVTKLNGRTPVASDETSPQRLAGDYENASSLNIVNVRVGDYSTLSDGFPACWTCHSAQGTEWESTSQLKANTYGDGTISVVSVNGKSLLYKSGANAGVSGHNNMDLCVNNIAAGDYFLFSVPVHSISKGAEVQFSVNMQARGNGAPKYWLFEYYDAGRWNTVEDSYKTTKTLPDGTKYSYYILPYSVSDQFTTFIATFNLTEGITDSHLRMRVRAVGSENVIGGALKAESKSFVCLPASQYVAAEVQVFDSRWPEVRDTRKLGALGNSFTYYFETAMMLQRIARSQGHRIITRVNHKGSQSFTDHLSLELSQTIMEEGGYDLFFIQDVSTKEAILGDDPESDSGVKTLADAGTLSSRIKQYSPSAKLFVEQTWAYIYPHSTGKYDQPYMGFGSYGKMDEMILAGCTKLLENCPDIDAISPIGAGFASYRALYPEFYPSGGNVKDKVKSLYVNNNDSTDNQHANINGAYMKSCINYLSIYGEPFNGEVDDCGVNPEVASRIRSLAQKLVLGE